MTVTGLHWGSGGLIPEYLPTIPKVKVLLAGKMGGWKGEKWPLGGQ